MLAIGGAAFAILTNDSPKLGLTMTQPPAPNHFSQVVPIPPNPVWIQPKEPRATTAMVLGIVAIAGGM